jgi:hypothetical protein
VGPGRDDDRADDDRGSQRSQEAEGEGETAADLGEAGDDGHGLSGAEADGGEPAAGAGDAVAAPPAEQLLGAVRGEDEADDEAEDEETGAHGELLRDAGVRVG